MRFHSTKKDPFFGFFYAYTHRSFHTQTWRPSGHTIGRTCQAPGFVEAPILGFLSSRGFCPGLVDPFGMDLDGRSVVNR